MTVKYGFYPDRLPFVSDQLSYPSKATMTTANTCFKPLVGAIP